MYKIVKAECLADKIYLMDVEAPRVARACQPGEFVIVKIDEVGERIPLTICDFDREKGLVTIVFQTVGASTQRMAELKAGDYFQDFVGPLGQPSEFVKEDIEEVKKRKYLFVAGGVGSAPVYPQVKWMHEHGIEADVIEGSKTKDLLILEDELKAVAGNLYVTTDDGSYERKGMVTDVIKDLVENQGKKYDVCVAIGPMIMMKFSYLFGDSWAAQTAYKVLALVMLFIGGLAAYTIVWDLGDVGVGLMTIFNLIALYPMAGEALASLKDYEEKRAKGVL